MAAGKSVSVPCPDCQTKARVPINKITPKGVIYPCPNCKVMIKAARDGAKVSIRKASANEIAATQPAPPEKRKKFKDPGMTGAPAWVVTFADLATLLLTFFVLILSFSNMDVVKYRDMAGSVMDRFGVTKVGGGSFQAVSEGEIPDVDSNVKESTIKKAQRDHLVNTIYDTVVREGYKDAASISVTNEGVRVRMKGRVLFEPGESGLGPDGLGFLDSIVELLKQNNNVKLTVEGHTDSSPVRTAKYPSNWELSTLRASTVLSYLLGKEAPQDSLAAAGFADSRPLFDNKREETRILNRRVEFLFQME